MILKKKPRYWLLICQLMLVSSFFSSSALFSQHNLVRYSTKELLQKAEKNGVASLNVYPEKELNYALPLIDTIVAIKLSQLHAANALASTFDGRPDFSFAFGLQIQNDQLKNNLLDKLRSYDCLCADTVVRGQVEYGKYALSPASTTLEYNAALANALYRQTNETDTALLDYAIKEIAFWTPFAWEYMNTIAKPGLHQLSIRKKEFDPCVLASPGNAKLWVDIIHAITGQKEYRFGDERSDRIYKRNVNTLKKDPDEQKGIIRYVKSSIIDLPDNCTSFDDLDIDKVPFLKEKVAEYAKKEISSVVLYTNGSKALLLLYFSEKRIVGLSKQYVGSPSRYLLELTSPKTIQSTSFTYRERFFYLH